MPPKAETAARGTSLDQPPSQPKPLIDAALISEFGGVEDLAAFHQEGQRDYTYVPGFSDLRRARDVAIAEYTRGARKAADIPVLPVNLRFVRSEGPYQKTYAARSQGYRAVTKADLDANHPWLTELPPGAQIAPSGEIKTAAGDMTLFVCDRERAARNAVKKKIKTDESVAGIGHDVEGIYGVGKQLRGASPTITKLS